MRATTFFTALCATAVSVMALDINASSRLAALTRSNAALVSSLENANPTSLLNSADAALHSISKYAATATGALASSLKAEETVLASILSNARESLSQGVTGLPTGRPTPTRGSQPTTGSASGSPSGSPSNSASVSQVSAGLAAATGVPVLAAGALAALALL